MMSGFARPGHVHVPITGADGVDPVIELFALSYEPAVGARRPQPVES
jgi:hypothetical protein